MAVQDLIPVAEAGLTTERGLISVEVALDPPAVHNPISVEAALHPLAVRNRILVVAPRRRAVPGRMPVPAPPAEDPDLIYC